MKEGEASRGWRGGTCLPLQDVAVQVMLTPVKQNTATGLTSRRPMQCTFHGSVLN